MKIYPMKTEDVSLRYKIKTSSKGGIDLKKEDVRRIMKYLCPQLEKREDYEVGIEDIFKYIKDDLKRIQCSVLYYRGKYKDIFSNRGVEFDCGNREVIVTQYGWVRFLTWTRQ